MLNFFKKSYASVMQWTGYTPYEVRYETYIKAVYRNPSVAAAYEKLESAYTNIEFKTFKKVKENVDGKEVYKFVPSKNKVVNDSLNFPSPITTRTEFMSYMLFYSTFGGRFLLEKQKGYLTDSILLYAPNTFEVEYAKLKAEIEKITIAGTKDVVGKDLLNYNIFKDLDPSSIIAGVGAGSTKLEALVPLADLINFMIKHNISMLKNRGSRGGFFKSVSAERLTPREKEELESKMKEAVTGYNNAGKTGFLPNNIDFVATDTVPKDLDWITGWEMAHKMIAGILGVPFSLVWDSSSTYNNSKEDKVKLYKNTVIPIAKRHAEFLTSVFRDRLAEDEFVWIDLSTIEELRAETMETMKSLESVTYLTVNEKRNLVSELTGVEIGKYKHENADKILVNMGLGTLDEINEVVEPVNEEE
ncbi:MAG: phage portal protein [Cetobacterium sp.]